MAVKTENYSTGDRQHCRNLPSLGEPIYPEMGGCSNAKKLLLLLLDSLNSRSNKNLADLDDDEKWLARKYFPMLIAESESSLPTSLDGVAEVTEVLGSTAMREFYTHVARLLRLHC
ncbi:hypothetical protein [Nostoc sp. KVJ3]|uniref:hypothetical protein n=1 Tax=Nostoc sp. KVJ3 TaxID=457945 RepID=UPI0022376A89|nr:hypothetical protein [Nostoc sp. KVJ3]